MEDKKFSHIDKDNRPTMVDVSDKSATRRTATAQCNVVPGPEIMNLLQDGDLITKKGPVFHTCIIAGTMAVKKTAELIPFCHPIPLENCQINIEIEADELVITCTCTTTGKTGIEMEALTGASVAALTFYDMCKAISKDIIIKQTKLINKTGGKSDYDRA